MTSKERAERFNRALMVFDELSQTILKGHLMLEEELSAILDHALCDSDLVGEARLTFFQKIKLVQAKFSSGLKPEIWTALEKFNTLRNQMAHKLDSPRIPKLIGELLSTLQIRTASLQEIAHTKEYQIEMVFLALVTLHGDLNRLKEESCVRRA